MTAKPTFTKTFRLTPEAAAALRWLSDKSGMSQNRVICELLVIQQERAVKKLQQRRES